VRFRPLVLCYHAVSDRWPDPLAISAAALEHQLRMLKRARMTPVPADAVLSNRARTFHVTFDDAYRNVAAALPLLERLGIPATVFACSDYAAHGRRLAVPELRDRMGPHPDELLTMTWDMLRDLAERGVEIGSHTASHAHLCELGDAELVHELAGSRKEIEDQLGVPCRFISYPYGEEEPRVQAVARRSGYLAGYAVRRRPRADNQFALPRVDVYRRDRAWRFAVKASPVGGRALHALGLMRRGSAASSKHAA
jgi:peptidoglycan/xylan/chitin deacetylase (PgdA/CDA1 family)